MSFDRLGLQAELLEAIKSKGYKAPTPVQSRAIPVILSGRDILARAQTGTGKTDAFALPIVDILSGPKQSGPHPRALVLTPTRELALQVGECIKGYARRLSMRCTVVFGGVRMGPQINRLKRGIDILVATPGRLLDLISLGRIDLSYIEFLVFDEADRMLDLGFSEDISQILDIVPAERRTMLFSATFSKGILELAGHMLDDPEHIEVTPKKTAAESVAQTIYRVSPHNKHPLLIHLITQKQWTQVLVFTRTKRGADKLAEKLTDQGISATAMHSNMSQSKRMRTLDEFKKGNIRILVATDVAARGLDIRHLPHVVNYDIPRIPEDYVHRIGRTGRAGIRGVAVSLVTPEDTSHVQAIEDLMNRKIPVKKVKGYTEGSDVPDFVLYRPGSSYNGKKVDKDILDIVKKRKDAKQKKKYREAKSSRKRSTLSSQSKRNVKK